MRPFPQTVDKVKKLTRLRRYKLRYLKAGPGPLSDDPLLHNKFFDATFHVTVTDLSQNPFADRPRSLRREFFFSLREWPYGHSLACRQSLQADAPTAL